MRTSSRSVSTSNSVLRLSALALSACALSLSAPTLAAPVTYQADPGHTHPEFEGDHANGLSIWRGLFKDNKGTIVMDRQAQTGTVDITTDVSSIEFGNPALNKHAQSADLFDVEKYPTAHYSGKLVDWVNGAPTAVDGEFTLRGQTHPLKLTINSFKCAQHPVAKREVCGADATAQFDRYNWGLDFGKDYGFKGGVTLRIQVEALAAA